MIESIDCSCHDGPPLSQSAELVQLLDAIAVSRCYVSLHAKHFADDMAEQTLISWCAVHGVPVDRRVFMSDGMPYLSTSAQLPNGSELVVLTAVRS